MATTERGTTTGRPDDARGRTRRLTTETKAAWKTTELMVFILVSVGVLIASRVIGDDSGGGTDIFGADEAWMYVTILAVGYMVARGLAKSGSRDPYTSRD
jgi:hypothetical protein